MAEFILKFIAKLLGRLIAMFLVNAVKENKK
jgi:hypothetical protein